MSFWSRLSRRLRDMSITVKFGLGVGFLLSLIITVAATGYLALQFEQHARQSIQTSWEIQQLVLEMDRGMERARRLHRDFHLEYPRIGLAMAHEQYAQPCQEQIAQVITISNALKDLISRSKVSQALRQSRVDLNLYLSSAKRFADTSIESVELVTELAEPERGLEAQLDTYLAALQADVEKDESLARLFSQMKSFVQDYRLSRKRFLMQSAFNMAFSLRRQVAGSPAIQTEQRERINLLLDRFISVANKILDIDVAINSKFNDFALQAKAAGAVSASLARLAREEVSRAHSRIVRAHRIAITIIVATTAVGLIVALGVAMILNSSITRRVVRLTASAAELRRGKWDVFVCDEGKDELSQLASTFNVMTARIRELIGSLEQRVDMAHGALRKSEERLRLAQDAANVGTWEWDPASMEMFWSEELWRLFGLESHGCEPSCDAWVQRVHPEDREAAEHAMRDAVRRGARLSAEWRVCDGDGTQRWLMARGQPLRDESTQSVRYLGIVMDITERKRTEEVLKESRQRLLDIIDFLPDATLVIDREGVVIAWNRAIEEMTGILAGDMLGKGNYEYALPFYAVRRPILIDLVLQPSEGIEAKYSWLERNGSVVTGEAYMPALRGGGVYLYATASVLRDSKGNIVGAIESIRDITERKRAEEEREKLEGQLLQAQKMESVGRLAGGVAHDFNNMLGVIIGHCEMALDQLSSAEHLYQDILEIKKAATRSADLTRQLLAFARKQTASPRVLDLNETISSMLKMLRRIIGEDIALSWHPGEILWSVRMDPSQIDQILANLAVNARDAILGTGAITLRTENIEVCALSSTNQAGLSCGEYVLLTVTDTGEGMGEETIEHIFEPFFTTKEVGKGTGLGLATVYGIVKQNGGFIYAESRKGEGTTFRIYLPRFQSQSSDALAGREAQQLPVGRENILLVEDDESMLALSRKMLESLGYTVLTAQNPREAIQLVADTAETVDLLITDVIMPEMNGKDLAQRLAAIRRGLKCLYMSGYTADMIANQGLLEEGVHFIHKPFTRAELAAKIRQVLEKEPLSAGSNGRNSAFHRATI